jgi:hypothetical protein
MSWGDPMAVANGRVIAIHQPVIMAIITIAILVHDHHVGIITSLVARRSTIIDRISRRELQRMHVQCAVPRIAYASHFA